MERLLGHANLLHDTMASRGLIGELIAAANTSSLDKFHELLSRDFPVEELRDADIYQLLSAGVYRDSDVIKALIPRHISPDHALVLTDHPGFERKETTPLCVAVECDVSDSPHVLEYLLSVGANVDAVEKVVYSGSTSSRTALVLALARDGRVRLVYSLVQGGATVQHVLTDVLRHACTHKHIDLLRRVVDAGGDINDEALQMALIPDTCYPSNHAFPRQEVNYMCHVHSAQGIPDTYAIREYDADKTLEVVTFLLESGADPNRADAADVTSGHMVSMGHKYQTFDCLLARGWDINARDSLGFTALHYAVAANDLKLVKYLIDKGALTHKEDDVDEFSVLHAIGVRFDQRNNILDAYEVDYVGYPTNYNKNKIEIAEFLLQSGVPLDIRNSDCKSALDLMCNPRFYMIYTTIYWFLQHALMLPYGGEWEELGRSIDFMLATMASDCLMAAGVHDKEFVKIHLTNAAITNNMPEYEAAIHANPGAVHEINMADLDATLKHYQGPGYNDRSKEAYIKMRRNKTHHDDSVYKQLVHDLTQPPSLRQLTVYTVRQHLLVTSENTSLYPLLRQLDVPRVLMQILTLEAFVDYSLPPGKREK